MGTYARRLNGRSVRSEDRERLAQLLRHAFPLSGDGSFTGVLQAIRQDQSVGVEDDEDGKIVGQMLFRNIITFGDTR